MLSLLISRGSYQLVCSSVSSCVVNNLDDQRPNNLPFCFGFHFFETDLGKIATLERINKAFGSVLQPLASASASSVCLLNFLV